MSNNASDKAGLVSRLLANDSALGIIAGLTTLAHASQADSNRDDDDMDDEDGDMFDSRHLGTPGLHGDKKGLNGKAKSTSRGLVSPGSPMDGSNSPSLSAVAKKYSVHEQRDVIRKLQEQNQILKQELAIEFRDAKQLLAHEKRQRVEYLQKTTETFSRKVDNARKNLAKLEEQIANKEQELEALRQQQYHGTTGGDAASGTAGQSTNESTGSGGAAAMGETTAAITRRVRSLENRLELALVKRNEMDSINKHFRSQIEKVRKDRVIFDGIYKKLEKELSDFQTRYDASVEELKRATEGKDRVSREIQQIQASADSEQRQYESQFKELRHAIESAMRDVYDVNAKLGGAGSIGVFGEPDEASKAAVSPARGTKSTTGMAATAAVAPPVASTSALAPTDSPLKRLTVLSSWKIGFDKALASSSDSIVAKYEQVFDGIKKMTGITDVTKIAEAITQKDEENFKRFKHVESLHREEAALKAQVEQLTQGIEEFKAKEGIATGATQKQQYRQLESKYHHILEKNKAFDVEYEETTNKLARVKSSVHSIHSMLAHANCAKNADQFSVHSSSNLALGAHSARDVTDTNVLEYLQAIEIFTSSLMKENHEMTSAASGVPSAGGSNEQFSHLSSSPSTTSTSSPIGQGPSTLPSDPTQKLRVKVPSFGGLNGVIILPANNGTASTPGVDGNSSPIAKIQQQQQQQRKKTARFELSSRKSLSQQQFAVALAGQTNSAPSSAASNTSVSSLDDSRNNTPGSAPGSALAPSTPTAIHAGGGAAPMEDDEEERAFTYDELRDFAAKHIVKKRDDPATTSR